MASNQSITKKYHITSTFALKITNDIHLRPYWPQTASEFEVRFQIPCTILKLFNKMPFVRFDKLE